MHRIHSRPDGHPPGVLVRAPLSSFLRTKGRSLINIKNFSLSWRWISSTHTNLPDEVVRTLKPLSPETAKRFAQSVPSELSSASLRFEAKDVLVTQRWLEELGVPAQRVTVVWNEETAISLPWAGFCEYWDDFCYPSSDDADIFLQNERAFLRWRHYEVFEHDPKMF